MNPLIESACTTRKLLEDNAYLLAHATNSRLEELLNAIVEVLKDRDVTIQFEDDLYRMSLEDMAARRMAGLPPFNRA